MHDKQCKPAGVGHFYPGRPEGIFAGGQIVVVKVLIAEQLPGDPLRLNIVIPKFHFVKMRRGCLCSKGRRASYREQRAQY